MDSGVIVTAMKQLEQLPGVARKKSGFNGNQTHESPFKWTSSYMYTIFQKKESVKHYKKSCAFTINENLSTLILME